MWQDQTPAAWASLRAMGVTAGRVSGARGALPADGFAAARAPLIQAGLAYYVENIATDFYAAYHRYEPGHAANWRFTALRDSYLRNKADPALWQRLPSLSDPAWINRIASRLAAHVTALRATPPLYFNLGDETGIADLAAPWDFDTAPPALAAYRLWLRAQYGTLAALNAEWGTKYTAWDAISPATTDATLPRADDNFAAWSDGKAWMDQAFASAIRAGADAVHAANSLARAGLEGAQPPGWGGYDYSLLAGTVDVMEAYDLGNSLDLAHGFNPDLTLLTTSFESGAREPYAVWHDVLSGTRGLIIWDDSASLVHPDGAPGPRARALAPIFAALHGPAGAAVLAARPHHDRVAILYSQVSFRVTWLLGVRAEHRPWVTHDSGWEDEHDNPWRAALGDAASALRHAGLQPAFLPVSSLTAGALRGPAAPRLLILPHSLALSAPDATEIKGFIQRGGLVAADVAPGQFDGHGRRLPQPGLQAGAAHLLASFTPAALAPLLRQAGLASGVTIGPAAAGDTQIRLFDSADGQILALQRDWSAALAGQAPRVVTVTLQHPARVTDLLTGRVLGTRRRFNVTQDAVTPVLLRLGAVGRR